MSLHLHQFIASLTYRFTLTCRSALNGLLALSSAVALTCVLVSGNPTPLLARTPTLDLRGLVVSAETDEPIPSPTIVISGGRPIFGGSAGTFILRGITPGRLQLRIEQIGYEALDTTVVVRPDANDLHRFALTPRPIDLEGLHVVAAPDVCKATGFQAAAYADEQLAALMEELRRNAERLRLLLSEYSPQLKYQQTTKWIGDGSEVLHEKTDSVDQASDTGQRQPYRAGEVIRFPTPDDTVRAAFFMRIPSIADLATPEFERYHCFHYAGLDSVAGQMYHRIDFVPSVDLTVTDVEGSLYLDPESLVVQRSEFRLVRIPRQVRFVTSLRIIVRYSEYRPFLPLPEYTFSTQGNRRVTYDGRRAHWIVNERNLVEYRFVDGEPGEPEEPDPAADDATDLTVASIPTLTTHLGLGYLLLAKMEVSMSEKKYTPQPNQPGAVREVAASELKNAWHLYLDRVSQAHEEVVVTRYGKPVAKLVPYEAEEGERGIFGSLAGTVKVHGDIIAPTGEEWEADA